MKFSRNEAALSSQFALDTFDESTNVLVATLPGQPVYELVPAQGLEFELKGMTGFSCQFKQNADGKVDGLQFNQPNGVFTAERIED